MPNNDGVRALRVVGTWHWWKFSVFFILWVSFIIATSSTVVRLQEFFDWFHKYVFQDETSFKTFQVFWGLSGFAIVKGWHAIEFAILFLLVVGAMSRITGHCTKRIVVLAIAFCLAFAITDEWHQSFVPGRSGTVTDVLVDSLGVLSAGFLLFLRLHSQEKTEVAT